MAFVESTNAGPISFANSLTFNTTIVPQPDENVRRVMKTLWISNSNPTSILVVLRFTVNGGKFTTRIALDGLSSWKSSSNDVFVFDGNKNASNLQAVALRDDTDSIPPEFLCSWGDAT